MGAAGSVEALITEDRAKEVAGEKWSEYAAKFQALCENKEGLTMEECKELFPEFLLPTTDTVTATPVVLITDTVPVTAMTDHHGPLHLIVAVDGSDTAHQSFDVAMSFHKANHDRGVKTAIHVAHVEGTKAYLPANYHSPGIKDRYEAELVGNLPTGSWAYSSIQKAEGQGTKDALIGYINKLGDKYTLPPNTPEDSIHTWVDYPKFLCVGLTGRKSKDGKQSVFGQVSELAMRESIYPVIVVKTVVESSNPLLYVLATDTSERAKKGYEKLKPLLQPNDRLVFLHLYGDQETDVSSYGILFL